MNLSHLSRLSLSLTSIALLTGTAVQGHTPPNAAFKFTSGFVEPAAVYEVPTHQMFALRATQGAENLDRLLLDMDLVGMTYTVDHQGVSLTSALSGEFPNIRVNTPDASGVIGAGAVLEDDTCSVGAIFSGTLLGENEARCFRHFDDPVNNVGLLSIFARARDWAESANNNVWNWEQTLEFHKQAFTHADPVMRERYQMSMFRGVGQAIHLVQDMCQPAHTRNDPHNFVATIEDWAVTHPSFVANAIRGASGTVVLPTLNAYFEGASAETNAKFFSDDTIFTDYALPSEQSTSVIPTGGVDFIVGNGHGARLARRYTSMFQSDMNGNWQNIIDHSMVDSADRVMKDNVTQLAPRAVRYSRGMINHFFRGDLTLSESSGGNGNIEVKNTSAVGNSLGAGNIRLYYEAVDGTLHELNGSNGTPNVSPHPTVSVTVNSTVEIAGGIVDFLRDRGSQTIQNESVRARIDGRLIAHFDGMLGQEDGVAVGRMTTCGAIPGMVCIPAGSFSMGSNAASGLPYNGSTSTQPVHSVTISQSFWMSETEITQAQYQAMMGSNPSYFSGANLPVEQVTWHNARAYCAALTAQEQAAGNVPAGMEYRLPTEAEWEYACRAGTVTEFNVGSALFCGQAKFWYSYHSNGSCNSSSPVNVGSYAANAFGLYDMHGNVWEWCLDSYAGYSGASQTDPFVTGGSGRVVRGGSWWDSFSGGCRSAFRYNRSPGNSYFGVGFRAVLAPVPVP